MLMLKQARMGGQDDYRDGACPSHPAIRDTDIAEAAPTAGRPERSWLPLCHVQRFRQLYRYTLSTSITELCRASQVCAT